ncbi:LicD family protein [Listeria booriae]|uniref:LicD family protein n=1 Tax=Listeria booriae TaxID=1552123 RepID=A0A7X1A603_9LIST|nr:LicD family protein [Listeria booriae]MBC2004858.1 LicD family protein [Listeria booriae]MBC2371887.1 LicD family protein [Listeria booriae]MBC2390224.1 LicD family protein [Listeria booriae]
MIHKIRQIQLEILDEVVELLEQHQLAYSLDGGTLIGSFVHEGFGKFDDDIDIAMPRNDYEKFIALCETVLAPQFYAEEQSLVSGYHLVFMKIKKRGTCYELSDSHQSEEVFIDIFPLDYTVSDCGIVLASKRFFMQKLKAIIFLKKGGSLHRGPIKRKLKQIVVRTLFPFRIKTVYRLYRRMAIMPKSEFLTNHAGKKDKYGGTPFPASEYFPLKNGLFEGKLYKIPHNPQLIIRKIYGLKGIKHYQEKNRYRHLSQKNKKKV